MDDGFIATSVLLVALDCELLDVNEEGVKKFPRKNVPRDTLDLALRHHDAILHEIATSNFNPILFLLNLHTDVTDR